MGRRPNPNRKPKNQDAGRLRVSPAPRDAKLTKEMKLLHATSCAIEDHAEIHMALYTITRGALACLSGVIDQVNRLGHDFTSPGTLRERNLESRRVYEAERAYAALEGRTFPEYNPVTAAALNLEIPIDASKEDIIRAAQKMQTQLTDLLKKLK